MDRVTAAPSANRRRRNAGGRGGAGRVHHRRTRGAGRVRGRRGGSAEPARHSTHHRRALSVPTSPTRGPRGKRGNDRRDALVES